MARIRKRVGDRRVLALLKAFLKVGVLTELGTTEYSGIGTPQGGIASPLLANIALSALDEHFERIWHGPFGTPGRRLRLQRAGRPTYRLIRYADDFVVMVRGTRDQAEALKQEIATVLATQVKLTLSPTKTLVTHIDDGFDFLGFRMQRKTRAGRRQVYTFPSRRAFIAVKRAVKALTGRHTVGRSLKHLLWQLNPILRGWTGYFRHAASKHTFVYLDYYVWWRVARWLAKKHKQLAWKRLRRQRIGNGDIAEDGVQLYRPSRVPVERYRYRGSRIPSPWEPRPTPLHLPARPARTAVHPNWSHGEPDAS
jgi:RNA-directed DNA polymerase